MHIRYYSEQVTSPTAYTDRNCRRTHLNREQRSVHESDSVALTLSITASTNPRRNKGSLVRYNPCPYTDYQMRVNILRARAKNEHRHPDKPSNAQRTIKSHASRTLQRWRTNRARANDWQSCYTPALTDTYLPYLLNANTNDTPCMKAVQNEDQRHREEQLSGYDANWTQQRKKDQNRRNPRTTTHQQYP